VRRLLIATIFLLAAYAAPAKGAGEARMVLLGTEEIAAASLDALPRWRRVVEALKTEYPLYERCATNPSRCPSRGVAAWNDLLRSVQGIDRLDQIRAVNRFINKWQYRSDRETFGRSDYWATPVEFLRVSGDCEDYAIAKYVSLRRLGFAPDDLRLVVLRDTLRDVVHAVTAARVGGQVYVLDNITNAVLPQQRYSHYAPYYSVNEVSRWMLASTAPLTTAAIDPRILRGEIAGRGR
jgi:predicted transglutaminase-like cysteine proteinase